MSLTTNDNDMVLKIIEFYRTKTPIFLKDWVGDDPNGEYYYYGDRSVIEKKEDTENVSKCNEPVCDESSESDDESSESDDESSESDDESSDDSVADYTENAILNYTNCNAMVQIDNIGEIKETYITRSRKRREIVETITVDESKSREKEKGESWRTVKGGTKKTMKSKKRKGKIRMTEIVTKKPDMVEISRIVEETIIVRDNIIIIYGAPQLGKTQLMLYVAARDLLLKNRSAVFILQPQNCHMSQFKSRIKDFYKDLRKHVRSLGIVNRNACKIQELGDDFNTDDLVDCLTGKTPSIKVTLGNPAQLARINIAIQKASDSKLHFNYNLFHDECDLVGSELTKTADNVELLELHAKKNFKVSATIMSNLLNDYVRRGRFVTVPIDPRYRGIQSYAPIPALRITNPISNNPIQRMSYIPKYLSKECTHRAYHLRGYNTYVPRMTLINVTKMVNEQRMIFDWGLENTGDKMAYILLNGVATIIGHAMLPKTPLKIKVGKEIYTSVVKMCYGKPTHAFKSKFGVANAIQYLKDNGGVETFPRITIISGNLASRGISFVSRDYGLYLRDTAEKTLKPDPVIGWRTQTLIYLPGKNSHQPALIQEAARVCGLVPKWDSIQNRLISTGDVLTSVIKSVKLQEDLINQAINGNDQYFHETLNELKMLRAKMATCSDSRTVRCLTMKKCDNGPEMTSDPSEDQGMDLDEFAFDSDIEKAKENGTYGNVQAKYEEDLEKTRKGSGKDMEMIRSLYNKPRSYVSLIIKAFVKQDFVAMSAARIQELTKKPNLNITNYDRWGTHAKYKVLEKTAKGLYNLNPKVVEALELV